MTPKWPHVLTDMHYNSLITLVRTKHLPATRIASLPISPTVRHSLLITCGGASDKTLRLHACWCARQALALVDSPDPRSIRAIEVSELFAIGQATEDELTMARTAAWTATCTDVRSASCTAAWSLAWADARNAACAAAWDAAEAAWGAATTAWARQIDDLLARILVQ